MYILDPETAQRLKPSLKKALGPAVKDVRFRDTVDADGESVLVLFLVVDVAFLRDPKALSQARERVTDVFRQHHIEFWAHLRFVTEEDATQVAS